MHNDARKGEEGVVDAKMGRTFRKLLEGVAKQHGVRMEDFVHIPYEKFRRLPAGSLEVACMDGRGEVWGVLPRGEVH